MIENHDKAETSIYFNRDAEVRDVIEYFICELVHGRCGGAHPTARCIPSEVAQAATEGTGFEVLGAIETPRMSMIAKRNITFYLHDRDGIVVRVDCAVDSDEDVYDDSETVRVNQLNKVHAEWNDNIGWWHVDTRPTSYGRLWGLGYSADELAKWRDSGEEHPYGVGIPGDDAVDMKRFEENLQKVLAEGSDGITAIRANEPLVWGHEKRKK